MSVVHILFNTIAHGKQTENAYLYFCRFRAIILSQVLFFMKAILRFLFYFSHFYFCCVLDGKTTYAVNSFSFLGFYYSILSLIFSRFRRKSNHLNHINKSRDEKGG